MNNSRFPLPPEQQAAITGISLRDLARPSRQAKPGPYKTLLSLVEDLEFRNWMKQQGIQDPVDTPDADYDWRGFYKARKAGDPRAQQQLDWLDLRMHAPDTWKTPYHETFSNESIYALPTAPHWEGNRLMSPLGYVLKDESKKPK